MGKTSPTTGTGKKAQKAIYKGQKYAAEEYVRESERRKPLKKQAEKDLQKISKGETGLETSPKKLIDIYRQVEKDAGNIFTKHREAALDNFNQFDVPGIVNQFGRESGSGSSALNQALAASRNNLSRQLASDFANIQSGLAQNIMGQSQNSSLANLNARLQSISGLMGNPTQIIPGVQGSYNQPQGGTSGMGGTLIGGGLGALGSWAGSGFATGGTAAAGGAAAGGTGAATAAPLIAAASSREVKENIKPFEHGLDLVRDMEVKQYDYTIPVQGESKDRIGLIAEDVPQEIRTKIGDINAVDVYGLVSILVNAVKQLDQKVKLLEAA